ncbi:MAG: anti-sigma factor [Chloroflexi bacterium]|nr:anti-sigma factor [Chloroflexota bacterium]
MECQVVRELLPVHAVDGLEPREARLVDVHIAICKECKQSFEQLTSALEALPDAMAAASPVRVPAGLKSRVLSAIAAPPTLSRAPAHPSVPMISAPAASAAAGELDGPASNGAGDSSATWRQAWYLRPRVVAGGAAAVLIVGVLAWSASLSIALGRERNSRQELAALLGQQEIVLELVDSNKTAKAALKALDPGSTSYGKLYTRPDFSEAVAMAGRLSPPESGEAYYLWVGTGRQLRLAGQMTVNEDGFGLIVFDSGTVGPSFDEAVLTRQSSPTDAPAGTRVLAWQRSP